MKSLPFFVYLILLCGIASTAQAFTAETLTIGVHPDGGATVQFTYSLSWFEQFAVFLHIADPVTELATALEGYAGVPVTVTSVDSSGATFSLSQFAQVSDDGETRTMITPSLRFTDAREALGRYWFAPLINADFSPVVTTLQFPDGYQEVLFNQEQIPSYTHQLGTIGADTGCGCSSEP